MFVWARVDFRVAVGTIYTIEDWGGALGRATVVGKAVVGEMKDENPREKTREKKIGQKYF